MPKIPRKTQKIFAGEANGDQLAIFATMKTGTPQYSNDLDSLQSAAYEQGWNDAILNDKAPYLEEMNGVQYGLSSQIAYLLQQGLACEWDKDTSYYEGSTVAIINGTDVTYYKSIKNGENKNINPSTDDGTNWILDSISKIETYKTNLQNAINTLSSQCVKLTGNQSISGVKTFASSPYVPNSTTVGTALRLAGRGTATASDSRRGYLKLGDGTLIQWGHSQMDSGRSTMLVSMPTSFGAKTSYVVVFGDTGSDSAPDSQKVFEYASTSTFKVRSSGTGNDSFNWLAIGR